MTRYAAFAGRARSGARSRRPFRATPETQRVRALRTAAPGPLHDYLSVPFADPAQDIRSVRFLAIDLETTSIDPADGEVLSVGFVPVDSGRIFLGGARRILVRPDGEVGQSATVHGLTDDAVAHGAPIGEAVTEVLAALTGRVLVAHFTPIEEGFLSAACERLWGARMPCLAVDTLELERRMTTGFLREPGDGSLRLWAARERYRLPVYPAHEALIDAIACAELFLAQVARIGEGGPVPLRRLLG